MNEGTCSGKSTIRLLGISAERPTNGLYVLPFTENCDSVLVQTARYADEILRTICHM
jgi:hypothetical protein